VGVLIPRTEVVSDVTSILSIKLEGVDAIAADNSAIIAVKQVSRSVGVEPGLQAVRDALVASGRRVVGVGADHDGGGLALVAGRWHEGLGARRLVFPADGGPFGAVAPDGKWSATGVLGDLPLTVNESTNAVQVSADFEGSMVLLSRGGQPIIVGDPEARLVYAGIDPDDPDWAKSELFCLAVDRMADWLAAGDTALSVPEFLSVEEVRGDATPEASRTTVARGEREPRRRALYPWFLLSALAVLLGLAFMGKSRAGR
jgi:hypothetical protein